MNTCRQKIPAVYQMLSKNSWLHGNKGLTKWLEQTGSFHLLKELRQKLSGLSILTKQHLIKINFQRLTQANNHKLTRLKA